MELKSAKEKWRIDKIILEQGLAENHEKAIALIMSGRVLVKGLVIDKPGTEIRKDIEITILEQNPYVGRGGLKLEGALTHFNIEVIDKTAMDIGASTGGFTDCLLKKGVKKVFAIDVGKGLLDWRLRNDRRVIVLEGRNIRYIEFKEIGEHVDIVAIDVSFISLKKVLPKVKELLKPNGLILGLIKPQFEVDKSDMEKKGIIKDPAKHNKVIEEIETFAEKSGFIPKGICDSPIKGTKGNKEFWIYMEVNNDN